jgi:hypothetical protein
MTTSEKHLATATIDEAWKLGGRDYIPEFLASVGIQPVVQTPFGRGTLRLYESNVLDLRPQFQKWLSEKRNGKAQHTPQQNIAAKNLRIEERLANIEAKLDTTISFLERLV